jgi:hypothetical protein
LIRQWPHKKRHLQKFFVAEGKPSNVRGIHIETHRLKGGIVKYAAEIGSGVMKHVPGFIMIGSGIRNLICGDGQTHRQHGDIISLLYENRLKKS